MQVERLRVRDFRSYEAAEAHLGEGLTVVHGANGAGKTNLLEALYFGCTARSFRTANERELVRFGAGATRVVVDASDDDGRHELAVGFSPGEPKRLSLDGAPLERLLDAPQRPLVSVFSPDRLELIKGVPQLRRAHLDQLVAALWPTRAAIRRGYGEALAQRNALLTRIRGGRADTTGLRPWDLELARLGVELSSNRARACALVAERFASHATALGLGGLVRLSYRARSSASTPEQLAEEIAAALPGDLARGYTTHGPHRDDLAMRRDGRDLRTYGSQGEQRLVLLALLLAERDALAAERSRPPLMLLDDVMSELDSERRGRLVETLASYGQSVVTTTELEHVPGAETAGVERIAVADLTRSAAR
ncbi:MAG TPA: DNA replication and repair protein RecF [Solirubrobacteraceae bacterium]|nr:DNA replication and repair protein RecF [Solirubrobacteraceae bacterium]